MYFIFHTFVLTWFLSSAITNIMTKDNLGEEGVGFRLQVVVHHSGKQFRNSRRYSNAETIKDKLMFSQLS